MTSRREPRCSAWAALVLPRRAVHRAWGAAIVGVRVWPAEDYTRVTLESDQALNARHQLLQNPPRLVIDIDGLTLDPALRELVGKVQADDPYIAGVRVGQNQPRVVRLVLDLKQPVAPQQFALEPVAAYSTGWSSTCTRRRSRPAAGAGAREGGGRPAAAQSGARRAG
jgi:N-acetylmuramoyl-L-alanine amidase